jgi:hypothetical protein
MKWNGTKNGALLMRAAAHGFEAIVTTDWNIEYQQNIATLPCAVVVIEARSNDFNDLKALAPDVLRAFSQMSPRTIVRVRA